MSAFVIGLEQGSLSAVWLECHRPSGTVDPIFEFSVSYTKWGVGDKKFTADNASLMRYMAELKSVPKGITYRLFCTFDGYRTPQAGWSPGTRPSTAGLRSRTITLRYERAREKARSATRSTWVVPEPAGNLFLPVLGNALVEEFFNTINIVLDRLG